MACPTCSSDNPEVASFCHRCGTSLVRTGRCEAVVSYAVQSAEGVAQFALISTVMPHTSRRSADNYRWAMILSGVLILGATALGLLPIAIAAAAFLVPLAYLVYIDDVNLWEEAPTAVVVGLFIATGALSVLVSMFFFEWVFDVAVGELRRRRPGPRRHRLPVVPGAAHLRRPAAGRRRGRQERLRGAPRRAAAVRRHDRRPHLRRRGRHRLRGVRDHRRLLLGLHRPGLPDHVGHRVVDDRRRQRDGHQVADLRHRDRHRGRVVLRQGRGVRRLHAGVLRELRPRGRRQHRSTGSASG